MTVRRTIIVVNVIAVNRTPPLEVRKSNPEVGLSDFEGGGFRLLLASPSVLFIHLLTMKLSSNKSSF